ncbi:MAG: hypothetical protein GX860_09260 [Alcaligenaceae bacterium]|nr:hypothetical protein [Alcaligenaceae bacterium]
MFNEVCALIEEGAALGVGRSGGPPLLPLTHWCSAASLTLYLLGKGMDENEITDVIKSVPNYYFQPEHANIAINILARRANFIERGPVTNIVMRATEPGMVTSVYKRAEFVYEALKAGEDLKSITKKLELQRIQDIGTGVARIFSKALNKNIEYIKFYNVRPGAGRRTHKMALKYFAFDGYVDCEVKVDGKVHVFENILAETIPNAMLSKDPDMLSIVETFAAGAVDLLNAGAVAVDVVVPAAVAAAMGMDPEEAVNQASEGATISMSIPVPTVLESTKLAARIAKEL